MLFLHSHNLSSLPECNCKSPTSHCVGLIIFLLLTFRLLYSSFFRYENRKQQKDEHVRWFCMRSSNCYCWLDTLYVSIQLKCESFSCSNTSRSVELRWDGDINWIEISDVTFQSHASDYFLFLSAYVMSNLLLTCIN